MYRAALATLVLLCWSAPAVAGSATAKSGVYELVLTTTPDAQDPSVIHGTAVLKDTEKDEVLAAPRITFEAGQTARVESTSGDSIFELVVASDAANNRATADCSYSRGGETVFAPRVVFELR